MLSLTSWIRILCITALCSSFFGCGKANNSAPALSASGSHPANWVTAHRAAYRQTPDQCRECHGLDLKGGITKVDCFYQGDTGACHVKAHGPREKILAAPLTDPTVHGAVAKQDLTVCKGCHGTSGGAGSNPRFNVSIGSLVTGCEASACHKPNMAHPTPWQTHNLAGNQANACALCHGATFGGGVGPACSSCHAQLVAGTIPAVGQCSSCHGNPPNGTTAPNIAGSHSVHLALPALAGNCSVCHTGGGSGAATHGSALTVAIAAAVKANSGAAAFNGTTCANVSCHGGQASPAWGSSLNVATGCTSCHQSGTTEYISYHSGQHTFHVGQGIICSDCHDMSNDAAHFANVTTKVFETQPSTTLRSFINYNATNQSCMVTTPTPQGVQFTGCHTDKRSW